MSQIEGSGAGEGAAGAAGAGDASGQGAAGAAASGGGLDTLLTRGAAGEADAGKAPEGQGAEPDASAGAKVSESKEPDPAALVPAKAEEYQISFAEGVSVDEKLLGSFKAAAHEMGIPQGQAQKLADFYAKNVADSARAAQEAQTAALLKARDGWEEEIRSRPNFDREEQDAIRTLQEFGSPKLYALLDQSLLGSHPEMFDFVVKVGKALAEPEARGRGTAGGKDIPLSDRLWPNMK